MCVYVCVCVCECKSGEGWWENKYETETNDNYYLLKVKCMSTCKLPSDYIIIIVNINYCTPCLGSVNFRVAESCLIPAICVAICVHFLLVDAYLTATP